MLGGRDAARLADADAEPRQEQLPEARRQAAERGEGAPKRKADRDDAAAPGAVGERPERDAERRVEEREGEAAQKPELGVGEAQVRLDRRGDRKSTRLNSSH